MLNCCFFSASSFAGLIEDMIVMFGLVSIECFMRKLWGIRRYYVIMICTIVAQCVCESVFQFVHYYLTSSMHDTP